ncbi:MULTISPECIES: SRPBCC family protein [Actinoalloteichus]|uniref:Activator of Hsp90 ATPase homologue 1/2-like C-terminal domain-containing protein n=1 Tax=Actinoalloteichus fjordicus TaxID=1612552 RepID=A0AAC9LG22_9PSEU|nr:MULTISPECIES: SRPBCC domain-containing protein [Actinoalloteichus]APU16691.1 hypothetical protein UA74_23365 [Actinoalloteichus fjordicus]APU22757.1 hypothetical protein UA75_23875 [Actinoalloteichus sp. GBA129-24]
MDSTGTVPEFTIVRTLDAPRELVWQAWVDPAHLTHWFHPNGLHTPQESISFDAREGERYRYTMVDSDSGEAHTVGGVFLEVVPFERLVFTWAQPDDLPEASPVATVTFAAQDQRTEMTFHLRGIAGHRGDGDVHDGWDEALTNLAEHVTAQQADATDDS